MMRTFFSILISSSIFLVTGVMAAQDTYVCFAEKATGFRFFRTNKEWESVNFYPKSTYSVYRATEGNATWEVKEASESNSITWCEFDFDKNGLLDCEMIGGSFKMNKITM
jgi:hypothetical protein